MMVSDQRGGIRDGASKARIAWTVLALAAVLAAVVGAWFARKPGCGAPCRVVPPVAAVTSTVAVAAPPVVRDLTAEEVAEVASKEQRLREVAQEMTALYREMAEARKATPTDPELVRQDAETEALRTRYEAALRQVQGVSDLQARIAELRSQRAEVLTTNMMLRAQVTRFTPPTDELRQALRETDARASELDAAIGAANLRIEDLQRAAWRSDLGLGELRRQIIEREHLREARFVEDTALGELRVREARLREEAESVSKAVAEIQSRGVTPGAMKLVARDAQAERQQL